eukprot:9381942-Prorocentrum_lima.AAC.1
MTSSLVGSEMCIRDRNWPICRTRTAIATRSVSNGWRKSMSRLMQPRQRAVSYTHLTLPTICSV